MACQGKQYGLITKAKKSSGPVLQRPSIFNESSDEEESVTTLEMQKKRQAAMRTKIKKQTQLEIQQALEADPTVYEYDSIYDDMERKKEEKIQASKKKIGGNEPKYIQSLLKSAELRKKEQERRKERKIQKEREMEGEMYGDKEAFVTSAYKKKMQELAEEEERERREAEEEDSSSKSKHRDDRKYRRRADSSSDEDDRRRAKDRHRRSDRDSGHKHERKERHAERKDRHTDRIDRYDDSTGRYDERRDRHDDRRSEKSRDRRDNSYDRDGSRHRRDNGTSRHSDGRKRTEDMRDRDRQETEDSGDGQRKDRRTESTPKEEQKKDEKREERAHAQMESSQGEKIVETVANPDADSDFEIDSEDDNADEEKSGPAREEFEKPKLEVRNREEELEEAKSKFAKRTGSETVMSARDRYLARKAARDTSKTHITHGDS